MQKQQTLIRLCGEIEFDNWRNIRDSGIVHKKFLKRISIDGIDELLMNVLTKIMFNEDEI